MAPLLFPFCSISRKKCRNKKAKETFACFNVGVIQYSSTPTFVDSYIALTKKNWHTFRDTNHRHYDFYFFLRNQSIVKNKFREKGHNPLRFMHSKKFLLMSKERKNQIHIKSGVKNVICEIEAGVEERRKSNPFIVPTISNPTIVTSPVTEKNYANFATMNW